MEQSKERNLAMISHLGGLVPVPWVPLIVPLMVWILAGDESSFVNKQAREAMNFQLSISIYWSLCFFLIFTIIGIPIAVVAFGVFIITNIVCSLKGAVRTSKGLEYLYPMNLRLIH
ncbi:MAG: DUF4870 domain-containing protein [Candidatus Omnitrophica bacterium]|nr:DUF4870 domain-containing protein [Candidatus Omnitrophota bacterium]MDE2010266.1 DUF4870 domain-containing protein [Candidatus Omnitrophota bacterium]MDE2215225.1 DUF4870 domain-containing protein [Candidatus Omnitrophota bacterium]MDE2231040.1 DUF4870 domain-containing protein [Candidatus Omnitrophota bacterium]